MLKWRVHLNLTDLYNAQKNKILDAIDLASDQIAKELTQEVISRVQLPPEASQYDPNFYKYDTINQYSTYVNSIKGKKTRNGNTFEITVGSNYLVKWEKVGQVPFGAFIEWGTGPIGQRTVKYDHGYPYTIEAPWDQATQQQKNKTGEWGMSAKPHLVPSLMAYKTKAKNILKEHIRQSGGKV